MLVISALLAAAAAAQVVSAGMYAQPVVNLDAKTFKQALSVEHAAMVAFVAPWCGHCKSLGPEYTAAAQSLSPLIPFYAVDCDQDANKRLCAEYQVKGFPTIKAFPRALKGAAKDYQGERKRGALVEYAKTLVPDRVKKLRVEKGAGAGQAEGVLQKFLAEKPELPHALLVHPSAPSIPFLWKVLGYRFSSKMHLGYIRDTPSHDILTALGSYDPADTTRDTPRAVVWKAGASRADLVEHDGEMKFNALLEFLQGFTDGSAPTAKERKGRAATAASETAPEQTPSSSSTADLASAAAVAAERKAKLQARLEEEERRDRARREKLAAKQAAAGHVESGSPVDNAPEPVPAEGVEEGSLNGQSSAEGVVPGEAEPPVPPEDADAAASAAGSAVPEVEETERTVVHEEL